MQIPLDMAVDLDQPLGGDAPTDLQTFGNDGLATLEQTHDDSLLRMTLSAHEGENEVVAGRVPCRCAPFCGEVCSGGPFVTCLFVAAPQARQRLQE
jgi:hypothetical protein